MRFSDWARQLNVIVQPATVAVGQPVLRVKDVFTTRDGSWEPSQALGSIPQWARDTYLKPFNSPDYFDDAGGDHHVFGCIWDTPNNKPIKTGAIHYYTWTDNSNHVDMPVKTQGGWANVVMYNKFYPDQGERGAWAWHPAGSVPADVVVGGGMPYAFHVSFFATWTLETGTVIDPPTDPDADEQLRKDVDSLIAWAEKMNLYYPQGPQYVKPS